MKRDVVVKRSYRASLDEVWELFTTKEGIESWWGPDGFRVEVQELKLETGGHLAWSMIAVAPEIVAFLKKEGQSPRTEHRDLFTEVQPKTRLAYTSKADFIPGVKPYPLDTLIELQPRGAEVDVTVNLTRMHDEKWTWRAQTGWEQQLARLEKLLPPERKTS